MGRVVLAIIGLLVGCFLGALLFGNNGLADLVLGGLGAWLLWKAGKPAATPNKQALVAASKGQLAVFGTTIDRPVILDRANALFSFRQPVGAWWVNTNGDPKRGGIAPMQRTPVNERRLFESLYESARFERYRRTGELLTRTNKEIPIAIYDEGLLIETLQNEDGSTSHIVATDLRAPLDRDDYLKAHAAGIGRGAWSWDEKPLPLAKLRRKEGTLQIGEEYTNPNDGGFMPLFYCELDEIVVAGEGSADPLARQDGGVSYDFPEEWR